MALGYFVYIKDKENQVNKSFAIVSFSVAIWVFSAFMFWVSNVPLLWGRMMFVGPIILAGAFPYFIYVFPPTNLPLTFFKKIIFSIPVLVFLATVPTNFIVKEIISPSREVIYGIGNAIFGIYFLLYMGYGFITLVKKYMNTRGINRVQISYLLLGTFLSAVAGTVTNLLLPLLGTSRFNRLGPSFTIIFVAITAYAIIRHRLMDIEVIIKKTIVFAGLFAFIFGVFAAVTIILQNLLGRFVHISNWISFGISAIVLLFLHDAVKQILVNITETFLFQKEYDRQQILKEISKGMVGKLELEELREFIASALLEKMKLEKAVIIDKDELSQIKAAVSIPIYLKDELYWTLLLGEKKSGKLYTKEDENMLDALSHEVSIAIENAINFQSLRESQMELMRQENLKFVSVLVKGLAHEIFNPLTPLIHRIEDLEGESFLKIYEVYENSKDKLAKDDKLKFKEAILALRDSTKSLKTNASHIHLIVDTLNKIEKGDDKTIGPVDIKTFLKEIVTIIGLEVDSSIQREVIVNQSIDKNLPPVNGNPTLLKQIFINLYKNACEAMKDSNTKVIDISCKLSDSSKNELLIEFSDTGPGIPKEVLAKLFTYGYTTKGTKGSGIGLNQCKAIIEKFGGSIKAESQKGKGAKFIISLPVSDEKGSPSS